jgi:hypothetical protein
MKMNATCGLLSGPGGCQMGCPITYEEAPMLFK